MGQLVNSLVIELGTTQLYLSTNTLNPVTYVYYIMAADGVIKLKSDLPSLSIEAQTKMNSKLSENGIRPANAPYVKLRTIYVEANSATVSFYKAATVGAIKSSWVQYLSVSGVSASSNDINVWMIDQNLYFDSE